MSGRFTVTQVASSVPFDPVSPISSDNVQDAILEVANASEPLVVPIILLHNGTISANVWLGYSELLPGNASPVVIPITGNFVGFTWSNNQTSIKFNLEFRLNTVSSPIFYTYSNTNIQTEYVTLPTPQAVTAGQRIFIQYKDLGNNAADASVVLLFKS